MIRAKEYRFLEEKLYAGAWRSRTPLRAMFELTHRCNFKCLHCYLDGCGMGPRKKEVSTLEAKKILGKLKKAGTFFVGFTGGEVFLRADIFEILWYARGLGFQVIILTNGFFLDAKACDELTRLHPNKVDITVHAMDHGKFDRITGVAGSAKRVFKAIDLLHSRGVALGIKTCGMQENGDQILKISEFARRRHIRFRLDNELIPRLDRGIAPLTHVLPPEQDFLLRKACYPEMFRRPPPPARPASQRRLFKCGCGYVHLAIDPYGCMKTCIDIDYPGYDLKNKPFARGWGLIKKFVDGLVPPQDWACAGCDLERYCSWCPARSYLQDGTFFSCDAQSRARAAYIAKRYARRSKP